jgi:cellulose synthase/poly-beta-1,6-N-acetylglucosamine synthase-like glycosyltransferase
VTCVSPLFGIGVVACYFAAFAVLAVYSLHRLYLLRLDARYAEPCSPPPLPSFLPLVTVQLPLYNERYVADRLLDAVGALDYPADRLEIQVLDDSDDDTAELAARGIDRLRERGLDAVHIRRARRTGYKAGALAEGTARAKGEFLLILDADFVPPRDLIRRLLPPLHDPRVAMVQARWAHLNARQSRLTDVQARILDAHFLLETGVRARAGLFFNFHGTAGLWRRTAILDAGGWRSDTLTEDLDLSYRAQMRGWRFVFLPDVLVPAELPASFAAFRAQQARWAEGTIATARALLPALRRGEWPRRIKREATFHLTTHVVYPATLLVALTALPALFARRALGLPIPAFVDVALAAAVILPVRRFYRVAARRVGGRPPAPRDLPYLLLTGVALAASNTLAVLRGLRRAPTPFARTPKPVGIGGLGAPLGYRAAPKPLLRALDASLAAYLTFGVAFATTHGALGAAPFLAALAFAFGAAAVRG